MKTNLSSKKKRFITGRTDFFSISRQISPMRILSRWTIITLIMIFLNSWGFLVHRTTHQLAVYELPGSLQRFFFKHMDYGVKYSVRPDQRRNEDSTEAPKHFIDLEDYGDSAAWKMPLHWQEAVAKYSKDTLIKYGYVPYHIITMKDRLTNAFRNHKADSALFYATDLAHYIGDAHVPLHATNNYDGQLTGQKGLHSLWESMIPEMVIDQYKLSSRHKATYIKHPEETTWKIIRESYMMVNDVLAKEREVSKSFTDATKYRVQTRNGRESKSYTSEFAKAYSKALGNTINERLVQTADRIADFWYTAWVDAGKPNLEFAWTKEDKQQCKREIRSFKKNQLLQDSLLISKKAIRE
jgi:hypothetical protein